MLVSVSQHADNGNVNRVELLQLPQCMRSLNIPLFQMSSAYVEGISVKGTVQSSDRSKFSLPQVFFLLLPLYELNENKQL